MIIGESSYQPMGAFNMANYQEWSQSYFDNLTPVEHNINNNWFASMLSMLKDDGVLFVPVLNKQFNKLGEEL